MQVSVNHDTHIQGPVPSRAANVGCIGICGLVPKRPKTLRLECPSESTRGIRRRLHNEGIKMGNSRGRIVEPN